MRWTLAIVVAAGCSATSPYRAAETLGTGETEILVAPQVHAAGPAESGKAPFPEIALGARHGVHDRIDLVGTATALPLGEKLSAYGIEAGAAAHLYDGARWDVAVAGSAGYRINWSSGAVFEAVHGTVPLSIGYDLGRDRVVLSPHVSWQRWYSMGTDPVTIPAIGGTLGYRWEHWKWFSVKPEIGWSATDLSIAEKERTVLLHLGVAIIQKK